MKTHIRQTILKTLLAGLGLWMVSAANAEDIDIYTKPISMGGAEGAPLVMFLLDNSGSMAWNMNDNNSATDLLNQRSFLLKDAALGQITGMPGVYKVGISQFKSSKTGEIVAEAKGLNSIAGTRTGLLSSSRTTFASGIYTTKVPVTTGADDAEQRTDGSISLSETALNLDKTFTTKTSGTYGGVSCSSGSPCRYDFKTNRVGLRFRELDIPKEATILSANLRFTSLASATATPMTVKIWAEDNNEPKPFSSDNDLYSRTADSVWMAVTGGAWGAVNNPYTYNITPLISSRKAKADDCRGLKDVVLLLEKIEDNATTRAARSYEGRATYAPTLEVTWTLAEGTPVCMKKEYPILSRSDDAYQKANSDVDANDKFLSVKSDTLSAMRFGLVDLPYGAVIESAELDITAHAAKSGSGGILIRGINQPIVKPFSPKQAALSALPLDATVVSWEAPVGWAAGARFTIPGLGGIVQAAVSRKSVIRDEDNNDVDVPLWEYDGTIGLMMKGSSATELKVRAFECANTTAGLSSCSANTSEVGDRADIGRDSAVLRVVARFPWNTQKTHRRHLAEKVGYRNAFEGLVASGGTPIAGSYLTTGKYLLGKETGFSLPDLVSSDCGSNVIVLLTDGEEQASSYTASTVVNDFKSVTNKTCTASSTAAWSCSKHLSGTLYEPTLTGNTAKASDGNFYSIKTYTIGFGPIANTEGGNLNDVARAGGGRYFPASNSAALIDVFEEIISEVVSAATSVAAPGAAVNSLNRFEHLDEIYYSLFEPSVNVNWRGNIKRYRLKDGVIVDVEGKSAVSNEDSRFDKDAWSWWSPGADGAAVTSGGSASTLLPDTRRLFTWFGAYGTAMNADLYVNPAATAAADGSAADAVILGNTYLSSTTTATDITMGVDRLPNYASLTTTQRRAVKDQAITLLRGGTNALRKNGYGAAIHASPLLISFDIDDNGTPSDYSDDKSVNTVFVGDSTGVLHMIDTGEPSSDSETTNKSNTGGVEGFAFIPQELLRNAALLSENTLKVGPLGGQYIHGMDGQWSAWRLDNNGDKKIDSGDGDHVYIYGGMRRGGQNVFALDVTTVRRPMANARPKLLWVVEGGKTGTPYQDMGQSWSTPKSQWVKWDGAKKRVVFFTGGYDSAVHDGVQTFTNSLQKGRQVYMVDAITGQLLWWATNQVMSGSPSSTAVPDMKYSITAQPVVMDRNGNGMVDGIYVVDLAGQVFRFDFDESATSASNFVRQAVVVAKLGATGRSVSNTSDAATVTLDNRRFFDAPVASYIRSADGGDLMLALISGNREMPKEVDTQEIAFLIRDVGAWSVAPKTRATLTLADMSDATSANVAAGDAWYMKLDRSSGEKGMGSPTIFNFAMLFTTYAPYNNGMVVECQPDIGRSRLYVLNALTAEGLVNGNLDNVSDDQRFVDNVLPGIAPSPQLLFVGGMLTAFTGTNAISTELLEKAESNQLSADALNAIDRTRWYQMR